jgi:hypothetical protein
MGFALGVEYGDPWGHRGATHSLLFSIALGAAIGLAARWFKHPGARTALVASVVLASHAILDTMTDGGLGCALLYVELRTPPPNMVYRLAAAHDDEVLSDLEIRTIGSPTTMTATVRQVLAASEPRLPVLDVMPLSGRMAQRVSQDTLIAQLTSIFSAIALFLACLGLYGAMSYGINRRVPEIGLRMALGADRFLR